MASDSDTPTVGFTVKELITRVEGKIDAYAAQQTELATTVHALVPTVKSIGEKVEKLELIQLGKEAVKSWHAMAWRAAFGFFGALASFAITYSVFHH